LIEGRFFKGSKEDKCLTLFPIGQDFYGIIGINPPADPAALADILIETGKGCFCLVNLSLKY